MKQNEIEALDTLWELLHDWGTFIEEKTTYRAPGQAVDIDAVVCTKLDFIEQVRPYRYFLDGYALTTFDAMLAAAAVMSDEHNILAAYQTIRNEYEEIAKILRPKQNADGSRESNKLVKPPTKEAKIAYDLTHAGGFTQKEAAEIMSSELKRKVKQYEVCRLSQAYSKWRDLGNLPIAEKSTPAKVQYFDPAVLDLGKRTDPRPARADYDKNPDDD